ncbi:MAG: hypothetical protein COZ21_09740 [Bacteroidetes bacterium CG_4_10_14_3_um_filter_31_20]|nr:hypothetical protein [Bacteroidota bacterium]PIX34265.1 MAG: hypothetical protein COZ59_08120 [Bacteroidetes bacterium CG_4_8_14_3_um_filter_31_14]PIY03287.1 MAG: hypothetical protein COZ21_09740 [Bacteroidetes bacterium CG_4_10_14_3_um_filter_31_20]
MYNRITLFILLTFSVKAFSQGELNNETRVVSGNEKSYALLINSNGWGLNYRYGKRITGFKKRLFDFDFSYIKHPKEIRIQNTYYDNQKRFVFGKLNILFTLKASIGKQKEVYSKFDKGGIAIKYFYEGGFSLAILKPIYYEVVDQSNPNPNPNTPNVIDKLFDYNIHSPADIYGRSSFFKGITETKFKPGLFVKAGLSFVYSNQYEKINALETGLIFDIYNKELPIMATAQNQNYLISIFISYRFGKVGIKNKNEFVPDN